jgi:hypothetical protein
VKLSKPENDAGYLDIASRIIFMGGLNRQVVDNKWPGFLEAFSGFAAKRHAVGLSAHACEDHEPACVERQGNGLADPCRRSGDQHRSRVFHLELHSA